MNENEPFEQGHTELADLALLILSIARKIPARGNDEHILPLNPSELAVMGVVDANGGISPSMVARATGLQPASLSVILRQLEARDLVVRHRSKTNGRSVSIFATQRHARNLRLLRREWTVRLAAALAGDLTDVVPAVNLLNRIDRELRTGHAGNSEPQP